MDPLRRDDLERALNTSPEEKARQALDMMALGIELQGEKLRRQHPTKTEAEIELLLRAWLARES